MTSTTASGGSLRTASYQAQRRYREDTLVLETEFETADGLVRLIDCMPIRENHPQVVRVVEGVRGEVAMRMDLVHPLRLRVDDPVGAQRSTDCCARSSGPDALALWTPVPTRGEDMTTVADFTVSAGEHIPFVLIWYPSHEEPPRPVDARYAVHDTAGVVGGVGRHVQLSRATGATR